MIHLPHPKYDNIGAMAVTLAQTLGQNLGMMWNKHRSSAGIWGPPPQPCPNPSPQPVGGTVTLLMSYCSGDCKCPDSWLGCIMEDTG